jgi:hypothetical protein
MSPVNSRTFSFRDFRRWENLSTTSWHRAFMGDWMYMGGLGYHVEINGYQVDIKYLHRRDVYGFDVRLVEKVAVHSAFYEREERKHGDVGLHTYISIHHT